MQNIHLNKLNFVKNINYNKNTIINLYKLIGIKLIQF